ncbi:septum site-determining protein Ssd [Phytomonospora endophytica]|uniref:Secretion/DNA translocation related CpaE-like protein n=1 Tax=Phytomonospora endophytica TaxID=714109 RepID=A0A841FI57_9ACTN|nr:septum site-determining protein Ssd [Phytomonospora endophytica]MBB6035435.1 secretion/DNA translocation related CpaE-like protein [Phytomonospora endophytica]GIG63813.1 septum formation initiator [Phytomonospora endophytica]
MSTETSTERPLFITADTTVLDGLLRITAAARLDPVVAPDPEAARRYWSRSPCVVIGPDAAEACARAGLPQRERVAVLLPDDPGARTQPWGAAVRIGASYVAPLTAAHAWLTRWFAPEEVALAPVIGVVGGGGGAGSSVMAAAIAVRAARNDARTLLADFDPLGGGLDLLLAWERHEGLRWPEIEEPPAELFAALPHDDHLALLSTRGPDPLSLDPAAPVPPGLAERLLDAARREFDLVVADLPRRPDAAAARVAERCTSGYLVVRGDVHGSAAARSVVTAYAPHWEPPRLLVRRTPGVSLPPEDIARTLGVPLGAVYESEPGLAARLHHGSFEHLRDRSRIAGLCADLLADLEEVAA